MTTPSGPEGTLSGLGCGCVLVAIGIMIGILVSLFVIWWVVRG